jgi:hypothetical protein
LLIGLAKKKKERKKEKKFIGTYPSETLDDISAISIVSHTSISFAEDSNSIVVTS